MAEFRIGDESYVDQREFIDSGRRCGTPRPSYLQVRRVDGNIAEFRRVNPAYRRRKGCICFNVQFIHITDGDDGRISEEQRVKQIEVLNEAFNPHQIKFHYDPSSVKEADNSVWFRMGHRSTAEREAKTALHVAPETHLNFYTAGIGGGLLGWATFPYELAGDRDMDGVVMLHSTLPGGSTAPYNLGQTATHESGHWLGLYHTFQSGCVGVGDHVDDTVAHGGPNYGKPEVGLPHNACDPNNDAPVKNFMNYVDDDWMDHFTEKQGGRMREQIATFRPDLLASCTDDIGRFQRVRLIN